MKALLPFILCLFLHQYLCEEKYFHDLFNISSVIEAYNKVLPAINKIDSVIPVKTNDYCFKNMTNMKLSYSKFTPKTIEFAYDKRSKDLHVNFRNITLTLNGAIHYNILKIPITQKFKAYLNNYRLKKMVFIKYKKNQEGKYYYEYSYDRGNNYYDLNIKAERLVKEALIAKDKKDFWTYTICQIFKGHLNKVFKLIFDELLKKINK